MHIRGAPETDFEKRQRIVRNYIKARANCIVLRIDHGINEDLSPFGFHFELDKPKFIARKKELRRLKLTKWFHWIALYHHKYGIRHLLLVGLIILYTLLGAAIFNAIEGPQEEKELEVLVKSVYDLIRNLANETLYVAESSEPLELKREEISVLIQDYYKTMLDTEGRYAGSALHKQENLELRRTWHYGSAVFYAMTLFTTIGYGTIACHTVMGQALSLIYAGLGIPIMLVVLGDVGTLFLRLFTKIYALTIIKFRQLVEFIKNLRQPGSCVAYNEEFQLPILISLSMAVFYIFICACVVHFFDWQEGSYDGLAMWESFYFSAISFMTIGLGDVMPNNIHYSPWLALMFLLGLAIVGMINSVAYIRLETSFFNGISMLEKGLERIHAEHHPRGFEVFRHLSPLIEICAMAMPIIPDVIDFEYDSTGRRSIGIQAGAGVLLSDKMPIPKFGRVQSARYRRPTPSPLPQRQRAPTLGAFSGNSVSPYILKGSDL
uniref:Ion_trans_2 domain-containing protein n=1 Tax=Panagrellus redivivus TaxID=6233 RepID=A0A7E4VKE1_PANRE